MDEENQMWEGRRGVRDSGMETESRQVKETMTKEGEIWSDLLQKHEEDFKRPHFFLPTILRCFLLCPLNCGCSYFAPQVFTFKALSKKS